MAAKANRLDLMKLVLSKFVQEPVQMLCSMVVSQQVPTALTLPQIYRDQRMDGFVIYHGEEPSMMVRTSLHTKAQACHLALPV
jgi:hypothetical protein